MPPGLVKQTVCAESGLIAHKGCTETVEEIFFKEKVPTVICPIHNKPGLFKRLFNFTRKDEYDTKN